MNSGQLTAPAMLRTYVASVAFACASLAFGQMDTPAFSGWRDASHLVAKVPTDRYSITGGFTYANYQGRTIEPKEWTISAVPLDNLLVWFGRQTFLVKGRSAGSRLTTSADSYGARYVFGGRSEDDASWALQFEAVRPNESISTSGGSTVVYFGPGVNTYTLLYSPHEGITFSGGYTSIQGRAGESGDVYALTYGHDHNVGLHGRLLMQATGIFQHWSSLVSSNNNDLRLALTATYQHDLAKNVVGELEATALPFGMPLAYGRLTGLSNFLVYEPGGATDGLRRDFTGYITARITIKF